MSVEVLPPADVEAEAALISVALNDSAAVIPLIDLRATAFTHPVYRTAWEAIQTLIRGGQRPDFVLVNDLLPALDDDMERAAILYEAVTRVAESDRAADYARIVRAKAQQRAHMRLAQEYAGLAYTTDPVRTAEHMLQRLVAFLERSGTDQDTVRHDDALAELLTDLDIRAHHAERALYTGFAELDRHIGGIDPGMLIYLAARPGVGKSGLALSIARRMAGRLAQQDGGKVLYVSLEMSRLDCVARLVAGATWPTLDTRAMRAGFLERDQFDDAAYTRATQAMGGEAATVGGHLLWRDQATTTEQITMLCLQDPAIRLVVVDQFDLLADDPKAKEYDRLSGISRKLKALAMRHKVGVLCLTQISREGETHTRPQLADLRGTGRQEQDADVVIGLYSPAAVRPAVPNDPDWYAHYTEALVMKNRRGERGRLIPLWFTPESQLFTDWPHDHISLTDVRAFVARKEQGH